MPSTVPALAPVDTIEWTEVPKIIKNIQIKEKNIRAAVDGWVIETV